jgi:hypothetical protein
MADVIPEGIRLGIVRGISYGLFGKSNIFMPQLRGVGATRVRICAYWSQVEPDPGNFIVDVVDALLDQLGGSEEVWSTVCSRCCIEQSRKPSTTLRGQPVPRSHECNGTSHCRRCAGR